MDDKRPTSPVEYKYTPIQDVGSIRLLVLHPAPSPELPLEISLGEFPLGTGQQFGALSYTWATEGGDSALSERVQCEGAFIRVTTNCAAALRRLRQPQSVNVFWVDAICIDQSNDGEKSLQIPLMRQIYTQATVVGLWIGETSSTVDEETSRPLSELGMEFIHDFAVEIAERHNSGQNIREGVLYQEVVKDRKAYRERGIEAFTPRVRGLWGILHRNWWQRLWVVQELALSQSAVLMCGGKREHFDNLVTVIDAMVRIRPDQPVEELEYNATFLTATFHQFYMRDYIKRRRLQGGTGENRTPGIKALDILNATRNTRAADPRDKIYGILGFFGDPESDPENIFPRPDYTMTAAELYARVSTAIITKTGTLDVLGSCNGFVRSTVPDLPSWAAAWNDTPLKYFSEDGFNASRNSSVVYQEQPEGSRLLRIKGKRVDSMACVSAPKDGVTTYTNQESVRIWREWSDLAFSLHSYPTGEDMAHVLMHTLCWGANVNLKRLVPGELQENFDAWINILRGADSLEVVAKHIFVDDAASTYSYRASFLTWGRILCTTANSYLALVPVSVSAGDQIVIFSGGKVPFVLRPDGDKFKLVGPCYVHGIMDGEAFPREEEGSDSLGWFTLC